MKRLKKNIDLLKIVINNNNNNKRKDIKEC